MSEHPFNVLFLCTGNSARSIIAEAILNKLGHGRFRAYSAGSQPKGEVNPNTLALLRALDYDTSAFRSKSWSEFTKPGAPQFDFVFTVCDNAAAEACPVWPGQPMTAHWGVPDPAEAKGSPAEIGLAFKDTYRMLNQRIGLFVALPIRSLDQLSLNKRLKEIGRIAGATAKAAEIRLMPNLSRRLVSETLGTALLLAAVVGSGIMAQRLSGGNNALALLCNTLPTGAMLSVLILVFGPLSGAHFNPTVSIALAIRRELPWTNAATYIAAQIAGGVAGVWTTHLMFELPVWQLSLTERTGTGQWLAEFVATFGLLLTIFGCAARTPTALPYAVGLYITSAYWFTASTSFANPAVTVARALSDTFAGIAPSAAPAFIIAQLVGMLLATALARWLWRP